MPLRVCRASPVHACATTEEDVEGSSGSFFLPDVHVAGSYEPPFLPELVLHHGCQVSCGFLPAVLLPVGACFVCQIGRLCCLLFDGGTRHTASVWLVLTPVYYCFSLRVHMQLVRVGVDGQSC